MSSIYSPPARQPLGGGKRRPLSFASDNNAGCMPEVITAIAQCNLVDETCPAYGADRYTKEMIKAVRRTFEHESLECHAVCTGTASNCLALAQLLNGNIGAVCCTDMAHIVTDECGAPEYLTGGQVIRTIPSTTQGKVTPQLLINHVHSIPANVHRSPPHVLSITNCTEVGTVYTCEEVKALCDAAHMLGLKVHMDGARLANAIASLNCSPADLTWRAGIDALSLGLTKAGALMSEIIVFFDKKLGAGIEFRQKRAAQLVSKCRFLSVQATALLRDDLWIKGAHHANTMARTLAEALVVKCGFTLVYPVEANEIFAVMPLSVLEYLDDNQILHYTYPVEAYQVVLGDCSKLKQFKVARLLTHFATHKEDTDLFIHHCIQALNAAGALTDATSPTSTLAATPPKTFDLTIETASKRSHPCTSSTSST